MRGDEQGSAMLVVMLILLSATAVATFAVQSTSYEIRAVGGQKLFLQAEMNSEVALDSVFALVEANGPETIDWFLENAPVSDPSRPCGADPGLAPNMRATRISLASVEDFPGAPPIDSDSLGSRGRDLSNPSSVPTVRSAYAPVYYVCAYDQLILETPTAGQELGTAAAKKARRVTLTAQSYLRIDTDGDGVPDDVPDGVSTVGYHEISNSARAHALTIPYSN